MVEWEGSGPEVADVASLRFFGVLSSMRLIFYRTDDCLTEIWACFTSELLEWPFSNNSRLY
jgi:hypothetical protein